MGDFYTKVHEVSTDTVNLLKRLLKEGKVTKNLADNTIQEHQDLLRGIKDVSIIISVYSNTYKFLQELSENLKTSRRFSDSVICRVISKRIRDTVILSLRETQPIEIIERPDKKK